MATRLNNLLRGSIAAVFGLLGKGWRIIRRLSGDDGYERYFAHHAATHADEPALSRRAWFERLQQQKWSGMKRCC